MRAPKTNVWKTISKLDEDPVVGKATVKGTGKGAIRTFEDRKEKVIDLKENKKIVFEIEDGKANGRIEVELEDHELGTMIVHRADLDVGFGKGRYKKELRRRLDAIQAAVED